LEKGIVAQLTQATHGIGVILEHRYYGAFFPTPGISTEDLRFLTTEQALADQAFFSKNIKFSREPEAFLSLCRKEETQMRWAARASPNGVFGFCNNFM
jgi:hypothetical protein